MCATALRRFANRSRDPKRLLLSAGTFQPKQHAAARPQQDVAGGPDAVGLDLTVAIGVGVLVLAAEPEATLPLDPDCVDARARLQELEQVAAVQVALDLGDE